VGSTCSVFVSYYCCVLSVDVKRIVFTRSTPRQRGIGCHQHVVRPSFLRPSVTSRSCTKTAKRRISKTTLNDSQGSLVYSAKGRLQIPMVSPPTAAPNASGVGKNCVFRPIDKFPAQTTNRRNFVSIRHDGPRPRRCAGGTIRGVVNNSDDHSYGPINVNVNKLFKWPKWQ